MASAKSFIMADWENKDLIEMQLDIGKRYLLFTTSCIAMAGTVRETGDYVALRDVIIYSDAPKRLMNMSFGMPIARAFAPEGADRVEEMRFESKYIMDAVKLMTRKEQDEDILKHRFT